MDKTLEKNNNWWKQFCDNKGEDERLREIFEGIELIKKRGTEETLKKVLELIRDLDKVKYEEDIDKLYKKLREVVNKSSGYMNEDINWWDKFYIEKQNDTELNKVLKALDEADESGEQEVLDKAIELIRNLDTDRYKYDIDTLDRKVRILEKRLERQVSDNFGSMLKSLREKRGLSLARLGEMTEISASYINRIELGKRKAPSIPIIKKLANALDVDISTLLNTAEVEDESKDIQSLRELIFSNNICLKEDEKSIGTDKKQQLLDIIDHIVEIEWEKNKHFEILELIELIDVFKQ